MTKDQIKALINQAMEDWAEQGALDDVEVFLELAADSISRAHAKALESS